MDSIFETLMKNSAICVSDLQKCKSEIRAVRAQKSSGSRSDACVQNDDFRRKATPYIDYVYNNQPKLDCLLAGNLDDAPSDIGKLDIKSLIG